MRKNVVYSLLALSAVPAGANAVVTPANTTVDSKKWSADATVKPGKDGDQDTILVSTGVKIEQQVAELVKGKYKYSARVLTKESDLVVSVGGASATAKKGAGWQDVTVEFELNGQSAVTVSVSSKDGKEYQFIHKALELDFDFDAAVAELQKQLDELINTIDGYNDATKEEGMKKASAIAEVLKEVQSNQTYATYVKYTLWDLDNSSITAQIKDLADETEAEENAYQNTTVYGDLVKAIASVQSNLDAVKKQIDAVKEDATAENNVQKQNLLSEYASIKAELDKYAEDAKTANGNGSAATFDEGQANLNKIDGKVKTLQTKIEPANNNYAAYDEVNAAIKASTNVYNNSIDALQKALTSYPDYAKVIEKAQNDLAKLYTEIYKAQNANVASYKAGTAVADKAANLAMLPADADIKAIADGAIAKVEGLKKAFDARTADVKTLQDALDAVKDYDKFAEKNVTEINKQKEAIQKLITALSEKVNKANAEYKADADSYTIGSLDISADQAKIDAELGKLQSYYNTAKDNFDAYTAQKAVLDGLQKTSDDVTKELADKNYVKKDGTDAVSGHYTDYVKDINEKLSALQTTVKKNFDDLKAKGNDPDVSAITTLVNEYEANAPAAVDHNADLATKIKGDGDKVKGYQAELDELSAKVKDLDVYTADGYDYKGKVEAIQKRIDAIWTGIANAIKENGKKHWTAMLAVADDDVTADIAALAATVDADQEKYLKDTADEAWKNLSAQYETLYNAVVAKRDEVQPDVTAEKMGNSYDDIKKAFDALVKRIADVKTEADKAYAESDNVSKYAALSPCFNEVSKISDELSALAAKVSSTKEAVAKNNATNTTATAAAAAANTAVEAYKTAYEATKVNANDADVAKDFKAKYDKLVEDLKKVNEDVEKSFKAETLAADYTGKGFKTTLENIKATAEGYTKTNADITKAGLVAQEEANYEGRVKVEAEYGSVTAALAKAKADVAAIDGIGAAEDYYVNTVLKGYEDTNFPDIKTAVTDAYKNKALMTKDQQDAYIGKNGRIPALVKLIEAVKDTAKKNLDAYNQEKSDKFDLQAYWNKVYSFIDENDLSSKHDQYLSDLNAIQAEINTFSADIEKTYAAGQSVEKKTDIATENARIEAAIKAVEDQQSGTYNEQIAADNQARYDAFLKTLGEVEQAYADCAAMITDFTGIGNDGLQSDIDDAAAKSVQNIYTNNYRKKIDDLAADAKKSKTDTNSPDRYDADSKFQQDAIALLKELNDYKSQFTSDVKTVATNFWNTVKPGFESQVKAAESSISSYSKEAQKDAFKDVKTIISNGDKAAVSGTADGVKQLAVIASDLQKNINSMLAADTNEAAKVDVDARIAERNEQVEADLAYLNGLSGDIDEAAKEDAIRDYEDHVTWTLREAEGVRDDAYAAVELPSRRGYILSLLADYDSYTGVKAYADNEAAVAAMTEALTNVQAELDAAKAQIAGYVVSNDAILTATIESLQTRIDNINKSIESYKKFTKLATDKNRASVEAQANKVSADIETLLADAFNTEKAQLKKDLETLKAQYNLYASGETDSEQAAEYKKLIDEIEADLTALSYDSYKVDDKGNVVKDKEGNPVVDHDFNVARIIAIEGRIADLRTDITSKNNESFNGQALSEINDAIAAVEKKAAFEGLESVKDQFEAELAEIADAIANVKSDVEAKKANIGYYKNAILTDIDNIEAQLDAVIEKAKAAKAKIDANEAAYVRLTAQIDAVQERLDAAEAAYAENEWYRVDFWSGGIHWTDYYEYAGIVGAVDGLRADVESDYAAIALTEGYDITSRCDYIVNRIVDLENNIAYWETSTYKNYLSSVCSSLLSAVSSKNFAGVVWNEIINERWEIYDELYFVEEDINESHDNVTSLADLPAYKETLAEIQKRIDALRERIETDQLGDADHDGMTDVADFGVVIDYITGKKDAGEQGSADFVAADINEDGKINIADATAIANLILYGNVSGPSLAPAFVNNSGEESLSLAVVATQANVQRLAVNLDNVKAYSGMQLDLVLPQGMQLVGMQLGSRAENHGLQSGQVDGVERIVVATVSNETFEGNSGAVLYLDVEKTHNYMSGDVEVRNILVAEPNANVTELEAVNGTTGVNGVEEKASAADRIYNLGGSLMNHVRKGINILRGVDGSTRKVAEK